MDRAQIPIQPSAESGLISAVYETIFKPGVKARGVFNRALKR
jgi:hypothetical protein